MKKFLYNTAEFKKYRQDLRKNATHQEWILWLRLRRSQLGYKFRRQYGIGNYIVDFYCPEKNLVIELDGIQHENNEEYDLRRTRFLNDLGIKVIRFWNGDINQSLDGVIKIILEGLAPPRLYEAPLLG